MTQATVSRLACLLYGAALASLTPGCSDSAESTSEQPADGGSPGPEAEGGKGQGDAGQPQVQDPLFQKVVDYTDAIIAGNTAGTQALLCEQPAANLKIDHQNIWGPGLGYLYYFNRKNIETLKPVRVGYLGDFAYVEFRVVMNTNDKTQVEYPAMIELVRRGQDWKLCGERSLQDGQSFPIELPTKDDGTSDGWIDDPAIKAVFRWMQLSLKDDWASVAPTVLCKAPQASLTKGFKTVPRAGFFGSFMKVEYADGKAYVETGSPRYIGTTATAGGYDYRFTLTKEGGSWKPCQWGSPIAD